MEITEAEEVVLFEKATFLVSSFCFCLFFSFFDPCSSFLLLTFERIFLTPPKQEIQQFQKIFQDLKKYQTL